MCKKHYNIMSIAIPTISEQEKVNEPIFIELIEFIRKYKLFAGETEAFAKDNKDLEIIMETMYDNLYNKGEEYIKNV